MTQLKSLFQPIKVGKLELKNRIVMTAMELGYTPDGRMTERLKDFYAARAKGGVGLIICRLPAPSEMKLRMTIPRAEMTAGLRELTTVIHAGGAKVAAQLVARPIWTQQEGAPYEFVGPSAFAPPRGGRSSPPPRSLTIEEIEQIVAEKGEEAQMMMEAGFDVIEVHAHGGVSLPSQFISPLTNRRTDRYGGSMENRYRFLFEILDSARKKVGKDFPITVRISGADFLEGGCTLEDSKKAAPMLEKAGFSAINVTTGWHEASVAFFQISVTPASFVYLAEEIKKMVGIPVIGGSKVSDPVLADQLIVDGRVDMVFMARSLIADPELPNKAREDRVDEICPCFACNYCFDVSRLGTNAVLCAINARAGREAEYVIKPAAKRKKVLVVGGGPAGMEAARVAALRGHSTLQERTDRLGGNLDMAALPPFKQYDITRVINYLSRQMELCGVALKLNREATAESILRGKPDVVILATGASPIVPNFPGIKESNVAMAFDILTGARQTGDNVVVIGGGMIGCETAELLAEKGKKVTILEMLDRLGNDIGGTYRWVIMQRLRKAGVRMEPKTRAEEITGKGVRANQDGSSKFFEGETVVVAVGLKSENGLFQQLNGKVASLYTVGDCVAPHRVAEAVESAFRVAKDI